MRRSWRSVLESFEELSKSHFQRVEVLSCVDRLRKNVPQLSGFERERVLINGANGRGANFCSGGTFALPYSKTIRFIEHHFDVVRSFLV